MRSGHRSALIWLALIASSPLHPQSIHSGTIIGTVTDPSGAFIAGASVALENKVAGYKQTATTDSAGS